MSAKWSNFFISIFFISFSFVCFRLLYAFWVYSFFFLCSLLNVRQCIHELEKVHLFLRERDKEIGYLKQEIEHLKEFLAL
jgi:hypothetical protein